MPKTNTQIYQENETALKKVGVSTLGVWNALDADQKLQKLNEAKAKSMTSNTNTGSANSAGALNSALPELDKLLTRYDALTNKQTVMLELLNIAGEALEHEAKTRKAIVTELGQVGVLQQRTNARITEAEQTTAKWGISQDDILNTVTAIGKEVGRNISFTADEIDRLSVFQKAFKLTEHEVASMVKMFDQMGDTIGNNITKATEMADVARMMGVNMEAFMENMGQNMKMLNLYNFADGVKGFAKMAAQSERLGLGMEQVAGLAEKVMDPEGAIDLAAQLQVIGGGFGDLADPMKLMYMATNDLQGLQEAVIGIGKEMVVVGEKGELMFPPTAQRQLRDMAKALDMPQAELANMIKLQKKFETVQNQMTGDLLGESEEVQNFISSIAKLGKGGKYEVEIESLGKDGEMVKSFKNINELQGNDIKDLVKMQKQQKMSEKDVLREQTGLLEAINNSVGAMNKTLTLGLIKNLDLSEIQTSLVGNVTSDKFLPGGIVAEIGDDISEGVKKGMLELTGAESWTDMKEGILELGDSIEKLPQLSIEALDKALNGGNFMIELMKGLGIRTVENLEINADGGYKFDDFDIKPNGTQNYVVNEQGDIGIPNKKDHISGRLNPEMDSTSSLAAVGGGTTKTQVELVGNKSINITLEKMPWFTMDGKNMFGKIVKTLKESSVAARAMNNALQEGSNTVAPNYQNMDPQAFGPLNT